MKNCKYIILFMLLNLFIFSGLTFCQAKVEEMKRKGLLSYQAEKFTEAVDQFSNYIIAKPQIGDGYNSRGLCYEKLTQYQNAVSDFKKAIELNPAESEYTKNLDRVRHVWNKELYALIDERLKEIETSPNITKNYLELGKSYWYLEMYDYAEKWYDEFLKREGNATADDVVIYSEILAKTGSISKGEKALKKYIDKYPGEWRLWSRYGYFNYWLGKYKAAQDAFTESLSLKPDFKEALDGSELIRNKEYKIPAGLNTAEPNDSIDKYYEILKDKPGDDETRFLLVNELQKANRISEAKQQIIYLQPNYEDDSRFKQIIALLDSNRNTPSANNPQEIKKILETSPGDRQAVRKLYESFINTSQLQEAEEVLKNYLIISPDDAEIRYLYAHVLTQEKKLEEAYPEIEKAIEINKESLNFKLLAAQLGVWLDRDTLITKKYLEEILRSEPDNFYALLAFGTYHFQKLRLDSAQIYVDRAKQLNKEEPNLIYLISMIETQKESNEKTRLWERIELGRKLFKEEKYDEAKPFYDEIINKGLAPVDIQAEYALLQIELKDYKNAITIYDSLLARSENFEYEKNRGRAFLLMGDYPKAVTVFEKITKEQPEDPEAQIYLADSYAKIKKYEEARKIYKRAKLTAPERFQVDDRISDLPPEPGTFRSFMKSFTKDIFSYLLISPDGYFYTDNNDFDYLYGGLSAETNLNYSIAVGGQYGKGSLSNNSETISLTVLKGNVTVKASDRTTFGFGYGKMTLQGKTDLPLIEAFLKYDNKENLKASLNYSMSDGALLFYSPFLVNNRIKAHSIKLEATYNYEEKLKLSTSYQLILTEKADVFYDNLFQYLKGNVGNYFSARLGKSFNPGFFVGYEYYYSDFKYLLPIYYTPEEFSSHSLWAEWQVTSDYEWEIMLEGKVGYVPQYDYILREGNIKILYKLLNNFKVGLTGIIGDNVRNNSTYKSGSLYLNAFWSL